ncbi:MAG: ROK family protein [Terriglobia bacterium]|jgi:predicted NBD/HSP70 family sugar kinase
MRNLEESLFWEIFYRRQATRSELEHQFNVSAATISRSADELLSKRIIIETGTTISFRGRPPALLQINPELADVGGLELDRDRITAVVTDMAGNLLGRGAVEANPSNPVARTLQDCREALRIALADAGVSRARLSRLGVGYTGRLDVQSGMRLDWEGMPHWRRVNLLDVLRETFEMNITLRDRAQAMAFAHHLLWPENCRHRSALYVYVGSGIGAGILINGRMLQGMTLNSGEIGHIVIDRNGPLCECGKKGCLEALASLPATMARARTAFEQNTDTSLHALAKSSSRLTPHMLVLAAREGDPLARAVLMETGEALGVGIANTVQILNPSLVVLAGRFANLARDFLLEAVTRVIRDQCFEAISRGLEVRVAPFRKDVGPVGCALLASVDVAAEVIQHTFFVNEPPRSAHKQHQDV